MLCVPTIEALETGVKVNKLRLMVEIQRFTGLSGSDKNRYRPPGGLTGGIGGFSTGTT